MQSPHMRWRCYSDVVVCLFCAGLLCIVGPERASTCSDAVHGVLQSFCRKLVWHRECLWPQDLPQHCLLVLEAEDDLVPSKLARTMLHKMKHPCDVRSPPRLVSCVECK